MRGVLVGSAQFSGLTEIMLEAAAAAGFEASPGMNLVQASGQSIELAEGDIKSIVFEFVRRK